MFWLYKHHFETYSLTVIKEKGIYDQWPHEPQTIPRKCKINVDKANHSLLFLSTVCVWALNLNWPDTGSLFSNSCKFRHITTTVQGNPYHLLFITVSYSSSQFSQIWQGRKPSLFDFWEYLEDVQTFVQWHNAYIMLASPILNCAFDNAPTFAIILF